MENNKKKIIAKCEANVCPICGGMNLAYGCAEDHNNGRDFPWTCEDCGATGKEGYAEAFDGNHYDVKTGDGEAVEIVDPEVAPDPDEICPVCGGKLEYTGNWFLNNRSCVKHGIRKEWRCTQCHATGWAEFSEKTTYEFTGDHATVRLADRSAWDGKRIPATESAEEEHRITGSITLLNDFDMEDALQALKAANICASEENGRISIMDTPVSEAIEFLANEGILLQAITYEGNDSPVIVPPITESIADCMPAECVSIPEKKSHPNVCSHVVHTPQAYLEKVTGKFFFLKTNNPVEEIEEILEEYCPDESLWNYPLEEINHIVENDLRVVLVDVSTICEGMVHTPAYRWFEVPEGFSEAAGDKEVSV